MSAHGRILDIPHVDCDPGKSAWLDKGNREEMLHWSDSHYHRVWLSNSGTRPLSLPLCLSTCSVLSPPNKYFACFTTFPLWKFFSSNQRPGPLSLTTGLEVRIWCSHRQDPAPFSGWEPRPTPSRCRRSAPEIIPTAGFTQSSELSWSPHPCSWHPRADRLSAIFTPSGTGILLPVSVPLRLRHSKFCF